MVEMYLSLGSVICFLLWKIYFARIVAAILKQMGHNWLLICFLTRRWESRMHFANFSAFGCMLFFPSIGHGFQKMTCGQTFVRGERVFGWLFLIVHVCILLHPLILLVADNEYKGKGRYMLFLLGKRRGITSLLRALDFFCFLLCVFGAIRN